MIHGHLLILISMIDVVAVAGNLDNIISDVFLFIVIYLNNVIKRREQLWTREYWRIAVKK
jgi:hypothetical protein